MAKTKLKNKEEGEYAVDCSEKTKMSKKNLPLIALGISLIMLAQLIGGIGCLVRKSEPESLIDTAREAVNAQIKWLDGQKLEEPDPPVPLNVNLDSVESDTHRIGRDGGYANVDAGIGVGGVGVTGVGGDGGGGGGGVSGG